MSRFATATLLMSCLILLACLATSPESAAEQALGGEARGVRPGPLHRPGQPCLVCHGEDHSPGGLIYEIAGTVYDSATDSRGLGNAEVVLTDASGNELVMRSNGAGNFFISVDNNVSAPRGGFAGQLVVPRGLKFPLRATVRRGDVEQKMQGLIWRKSSCADCHRREVDETSNGPIYLQAELP